MKIEMKFIERSLELFVFTLCDDKDQDEVISPAMLYSFVIQGDELSDN